MSAAHKNECRGGARQVVSSILKNATKIIAACDHFLTPGRVLFLFAFDASVIGVLMALRGAL